MKNVVILLIISIIFCVQGKAQKTLNHLYYSTASSWDIAEWNVVKSYSKRTILEETVDKYGRVIELKFLLDGEIVNAPLCYLASRVVFEYGENTITEILYHKYDTIIANECEMYYKTIYHLDNDGYIIRRERFNKFDTKNYSKESIESLKRFIPEYEDSIMTEKSQIQIDYYYHSFAKYNKKYPVSKGYVFPENHYYYGDEPEKTSILNGLK